MQGQDIIEQIYNRSNKTRPEGPATSEHESHHTLEHCQASTIYDTYSSCQLTPVKARPQGAVTEGWEAAKQYPGELHIIDGLQALVLRHQVPEVCNRGKHNSPLFPEPSQTPSWHDISTGATRCRIVGLHGVRVSKQCKGVIAWPQSTVHCTREHQAPRTPCPVNNYK